MLILMAGLFETPADDRRGTTTVMSILDGDRVSRYSRVCASHFVGWAVQLRISWGQRGSNLVSQHSVVDKLRQ